MRGRWGWVVLGVETALALALACGPGSGSPAATPTPDLAAARAEATAAAQRATETREAVVARATAAMAATIGVAAEATAQRRLQAAVAARDSGDLARAVAEAQAAGASSSQAATFLAEIAPTATAVAALAEAQAAAVRLASASPTPVPGTGPYGLVGQRLRTCSGYTGGMEFVVERVDTASLPEGGLAIVAGVQATNVGKINGNTFRTAKLLDEPGRAVEQGGVALTGVNVQAIRREYGVNVTGQAIQPGQTVRDLWTFVVAPDVQSLTVVENERQPCGVLDRTLEPPSDLDRAHATNVAGGLTRLTATAQARELDRSAARPTGKDFGLVGQSLRFCAGVRSPKVPFEAVVEQADGIELPGPRLRVLVTVRVTNAGNRPEGTFLATRVTDDRLRPYNKGALAETPYGELEREYGVQAAPTHEILPGLSERQLWVFNMPPDVQKLTLGQAPDYR